MRDVFVAVPAWGTHYVSLAVRHTVPAIIASLAAWRPGYRATFIIHTDDRAAFRAAIREHRIDFRPVLRGNGAGNMSDWIAFERAHRDAIELTPHGALLVLLNSDIVVSVETMAVVDAAVVGPRKVGVSVGIRTISEGTAPPIGASSKALARWIWKHKHPLTNEMIWGRGRAVQPTQLFFPYDEDDETVAMHCFHLTPMFIAKDRPLQFGGTIDDGLLFNYGDNEIVYFRNGEFAVAELSPLDKHHPNGVGLTSVAAVTLNGTRHIHPAHARNFRQRFTVLGTPTADHPAAAAIIAKLPR